MRAHGKRTPLVIALAVFATTMTAAQVAAAPASLASVAPNLTVDSLTATWKANSWVGSTGSPQPQPTTTADCGVWSGGDGTQVVRLSNGDNLWTFGDTYLGPAVTRQVYFNSSTVHNSMVRQSGSTFTTITGGTGCANGEPTMASPPITPPSGSPGGTVDWPASSIAYGSDLVKFYYLAEPSLLAQQGPEVVELPQSDLESGDTVSVPSTSLNGCLSSPIEWGAATVRATTNGTAYTYIYGSQQTTGYLYLARTSDDPAVQSTWTYYTGGSTFSAVPSGHTCGDLPLATLGGLLVATEFSVTVVNSHFWLVQEDPAGGTYPGWAVAHEATSPWSFSGAATSAAALFQPGITRFSSIDDSFPGQKAYAVRMMDPAAVTASTAGDVVVAYNVNVGTTEDDPGCIPLIDYDANVYRPRFIDVPTADLVTGLTGGSVGSGAHSAAPGTAKPRAAGPVLLPTPPAQVTFPPALRALGAAQLKAQRAQGGLAQRAQGGLAASSATSAWVYNPDAVPQGNSYWQASCPTTPFAAVDPNIAVIENPDGSLDLQWPNQGADVWYWVYWEDQTQDPGIFTQNQFWAEGPNADGWQPLPASGLTPSDAVTIRQHFVPPAAANSGDVFRFYVKAFAAGDGSRTSPDSAATATAPAVAEVAQPTGLTASVDPPGGGVTLSWNGITALPGESISYVVGYKPTTSSTWTYLNDFVTPTADVKPLSNGIEYDFEVAAVNLAGQGPFSSVVFATP